MRNLVILVAVAAVAIGGVLYFMQPDSQPAVTQTAGHDHDGHDHDHGEEATNAAYAGKVLETMDAGGYTYVHIDTGQEKVWAAGPLTPVETGSVVAVPAGMLMSDFRSDNLERTFDEIYFVSEINTQGASGSTAQMPPNHPPVTNPGGEFTEADFEGIEVPDGGVSIAGLYEEKAAHAGKKVTVRGKVIKFTPNVMNKNWIHLQDGTGVEGANDLTLTTDTVVEVGDVIVATGKLAIDKDIGAGYSYELLVENAVVTVE